MYVIQVGHLGFPPSQKRSVQAKKTCPSMHSDAKSQVGLDFSHHLRLARLRRCWNTGFPASPDFRSSYVGSLTNASSDKSCPSSPSMVCWPKLVEITSRRSSYATKPSWSVDLPIRLTRKTKTHPKEMAHGIRNTRSRSSRRSFSVHRSKRASLGWCIWLPVSLPLESWSCSVKIYHFNSLFWYRLEVKDACLEFQVCMVSGP